MFKNNELNTPKTWLEAGYRVFPGVGKQPKKNIKWSSENYSEKDFNDADNIGLVLKGVTDFDVDNPVAHKFIKDYLKPGGACYGRRSNPNSHYLFKGDNPFKQFVVPKTLESHFKHYAHGVTLGEIRNGDHYSMVPGSIIDKEKVEWSRFVQLNEYSGNLTEDIGLIMFSTAMAIMYPSKGQRDNYCTAIAGALAKNTDWEASYIDSVVFNIAKNSVTHDENYMKKNGKGTIMTNAIKGKKKVLGMTRVAEILDAPLKDVMQIFSWVGIKNESNLFENLKIYNTIPKYYELDVKGKTIRIMQTKDLMSYAAIQVIIEEQLLQTAPLISPKEWREIRQGLYQNPKIIDVPYEQSFFGRIANTLIYHLENFAETDKWILFDTNQDRSWVDHENKRYVFRLEGFTKELAYRRLSFEQRQMTAMLTEKFGAKPVKIFGKKRELRCWEVPIERVNAWKNHDDEFYFESVRKHADEQYRRAFNQKKQHQEEMTEKLSKYGKTEPY